MSIFNSTLTRTDADILVPQPQANEIFQGIVEESAVLSLARRLPNMTAKTLKLPILNSLPYAYFVDGDTGMKQTSKAAWTNKTITAEEIAVIIPVADALLADASYDLWAQIQPLVRQAFGKVIDEAILYGTNKPSSWPTGIVTDAVGKSNAVTATADGYADIMGVDGVIAKVEEDGYMVNGYVGAMPTRAYLRAIRDDNGQPIFRNDMQSSTAYQLDGQPIYFPRNGAIDATKATLIAGDWNQLVYAIRQDMTVTRSNQAVISDAEGNIIYNLYQQDMTALRFVMRLGWQLPNPINNIGGAARFPFSVLQSGT